jgi:Na+/melibiose symporter-like transporter
MKNEKIQLEAVRKIIKNVALFLMCIFPIFFVFYGAISVIFFNNIFFSIFFVFYGVISVIIILLFIINVHVRVFNELKNGGIEKYKQEVLKEIVKNQLDGKRKSWESFLEY